MRQGIQPIINIKAKNLDQFYGYIKQFQIV